MNSVKIPSNKCVESISILSICAAQLASGLYLQNFMFYVDENLRSLPILLSVTPVILFYLLLRFFFAPLLSALTTSATLWVLSIANRIKLSLTNDPLSWSDLSSTANASVITHYLTLQHCLLLLAILLTLLFAWKINPRKKTSLKSTISRLIACLLLAPIPFYLYGDIIGRVTAAEGLKLAEKLEATYISWDWELNIERHGLPLHLAHTSRRRIPDTPTSQDVLAFENLRHAPERIEELPRNIIYILCEACWHDEHHFAAPFAKLEALGFKQTRAISPVYGGSTVNATFELLTGLPANGALSGVIYQEYASLISPAAHTLPRYLRDIGYRTLEEHNHGRRFWRRDIVAPKFGFDQFISLEDMGEKVGILWADDKILFDRALSDIQKNKGNNFLFLTTVSTHGPYFFDNDYGQKNYSERLANALDRIATFVTQVKLLNPSTLIVVMGDHKPALNKFFYEEGILPRDQFDTIGATNEDFSFSAQSSEELRGDVPVYIYYDEKAQVDTLVRNAMGRPFFCLSQVINDELLGTRLPAFEYARQNSICSDFKPGEYKTAILKYPDWLYSLSILK
ncbi:LTA synthase family protein [Pseudomonas sp. GD03860]|uniref:LTA synthase family protein n=1 Tax=Pseudomonas TaxID=286 RepID=UPI0023648D35|nr:MULTISPECIES: LTA synthase family protein [Pseudomonas]MDD2055964.1 LTA synthase family protein [Pseudomonas putida]MDH0640579.1 LTA synthase family protein [Pseudomonas sp. GD03860]